MAFNPRRDDYDYLCWPHAQPHLEKVRRRERVRYWAEANWERLESQMKKETQEEFVSQYEIVVGRA